MSTPGAGLAGRCLLRATESSHSSTSPGTLTLIPNDLGSATSSAAFTKPVTAVALMMLYEEARVHLDDPVEAYLPEFRDRQLLISGARSLDQTVPVKTKMTIHHLLTHTSGLSLFTNPTARRGLR